MGRSPCCDKTKVKRGPWSQEEDAVLRSFVQRFGNAGNWIALPQKAGHIYSTCSTTETSLIACLISFFSSSSSFSCVFPFYHHQWRS
jgi:hypothetical protein